MTDDSRVPCCVHCGERVGVYERLWFAPADGEIVPSSLLNLRHHGVDPLAVALWHRECLPAERVPG